MTEVIHFLSQTWDQLLSHTHQFCSPQTHLKKISKTQTGFLKAMVLIVSHSNGLPEFSMHHSLCFHGIQEFQSPEAALSCHWGECTWGGSLSPWRQAGACSQSSTPFSSPDLTQVNQMPCQCGANNHLQICLLNEKHHKKHHKKTTSHFLSK